MSTICNLTLILALLSAQTAQTQAEGNLRASASLDQDDYDEDTFEDDMDVRKLQFNIPTPSPEGYNAPYQSGPLPDKLTLDYNPANPFVVVKAGGSEVMSWFTAHDYCRDELHSELASVDKVNTDVYGSQEEQILALDALCHTAIQDYESVQGTYACYIGLKHDKTTNRFQWSGNGQLLAKYQGQLIDPDTIVSKTNFGYGGETLEDGEFGMGGTPVDFGSQECIATSFWGQNERRGWINTRCATHDLFDKAAFICDNPFFGISSCSADSDCGYDGECVSNQCVPSASVPSSGRSCDSNQDCPLGEQPCTAEGKCTVGPECSEDTDCSTGACLSGTCVEQGSVAKGGYCDSDAECSGAAICNMNVNRCDSRAARGIKLAFCDNDSHCNQNGIKWSVCAPDAKRCETPVGGWCTYDYYCVSNKCDTSVKKCVNP